ncbi:MAG: hypothetical protein FD145_592 [Candidatus Saganbacteria bacterium]|uniref:Tetratricopeptide repeat protein n=1 Tax=Candidatus Saganbacteria bacterium TaxID=2575572 RepID=A0A833L1L0_UNCSA|nr:MAG: hypothetical protein FD145_592 [Candidatus Saganbacteria bacterium]
MTVCSPVLGFKSNNPVTGRLFTLEATEVPKAEMRLACEQLWIILSDVKEKLKAYKKAKITPSPAQLLALVREILNKHRLNYNTTDLPGLAKQLNIKTLECYSLALIYIFIAHELNWPVFGYLGNRHMVACYKKIACTDQRPNVFSYQAIKKTQPYKITANRLRGFILFIFSSFKTDKNKYEETIKILNKAEKYFKHSDLYRLMGLIYTRIGEYAMSLKYANKALAIDRNNKENQCFQYFPRLGIDCKDNKTEKCRQTIREAEEHYRKFHTPKQPYNTCNLLQEEASRYK